MALCCSFIALTEIVMHTSDSGMTKWKYFMNTLRNTNQVILAGTLKGVQGDINGCKVLAALSTVK